MRFEGITVGIATAIVIVSSYGIRGAKWEETSPKIQPRSFTFAIAWAVIFALAISYTIFANATEFLPNTISAYLYAAALTTCALWPVVRSKPRRALAVIATASVFALAATITEPSKLSIYGAATQALSGWLSVALLLSSVLAGFHMVDDARVLVSFVALLSVLAAGLKLPFFTMPMALACISQKNVSVKEITGFLAAFTGSILALWFHN